MIQWYKSVYQNFYRQSPALAASADLVLWTLLSYGVTYVMNISPADFAPILTVILSALTAKKRDSVRKVEYEVSKELEAASTTTTSETTPTQDKAANTPN